MILFFCDFFFVVVKLKPKLVVVSFVVINFYLHHAIQLCAIENLIKLTRDNTTQQRYAAVGGAAAAAARFDVEVHVFAYR